MMVQAERWVQTTTVVEKTLVEDSCHQPKHDLFLEPSDFDEEFVLPKPHQMNTDPGLPYSDKNTQ